MDFEKIIEFVKTNNSQAHLAVCNSGIFDKTVNSGVYGFPHSGKNRLKSFWRSMASLYNIGSNDVIFLYRMKGDADGSQEIHGVFKIFQFKENEPALYYDIESPDIEIKVGRNADVDCKVRFLLDKIDDQINSISNKMSVVMAYETKSIWGYRHPAVMNIGAARKKSVTSFSNLQTLQLIKLMQNSSKNRFDFSNVQIPRQDTLDYLNEFDIDSKHFLVNDSFLLNNYMDDEAFYYCYFLRAIKYSQCKWPDRLLNEFWDINKDLLQPYGIKSFIEVTANALLETIVTTHLQDELDVVTTNVDDSILIVYEFKKDAITQDAVSQSESYIDLLEVVFPEKQIFTNVIGRSILDGVTISPKYHSRIRLVGFEVTQNPDLVITFRKKD